MFGILNLQKPAGVTSRDVVNVVQRLVKPHKAGHAGTLDPMATGVLLVCVGAATRLISILQASPKTYLAEFTLGQRSDTDDSTGEVTQATVSEVPDETAIRTALQNFVGTIDQIPPAYSAVRVSGQRAYARARRGEDVVLKPKQVVVHEILLHTYEWPRMVVSIRCGSGTYIRSIARDLGEQLGCGGLMSALQRTRIGAFHVGGGIDPEDLTAENLAEHLVNPVSVVHDFPQYRCTTADVEQLQAGRRLAVDRKRLIKPQIDRDSKPPIALTSADGQALLAMAELADRNQLQPRMVFV